MITDIEKVIGDLTCSDPKSRMSADEALERLAGVVYDKSPASLVNQPQCHPDRKLSSGGRHLRLTPDIHPYRHHQYHYSSLKLYVIANMVGDMTPIACLCIVSKNYL